MAARYFKDDRGRWRDRDHNNRFVKASVAEKAMGVSSSSSSKRRKAPRKEAPVAPRQTRTTGGSRTDNLRVSIPLVVESEPDIAAAWTIAEAIVDALASRHATRTAAQQRAAAMHAAAHGGASEADTVERQFGEALTEALVHVLVFRGYTPESFAALAPPELQPGASGGLLQGLYDMAPDIPGVDVGELLSVAGGIAGGYVGGPAGAVVGSGLGQTAQTVLFPDAPATVE